MGHYDHCPIKVAARSCARCSDKHAPHCDESQDSSGFWTNLMFIAALAAIWLYSTL